MVCFLLVLLLHITGVLGQFASLPSSANVTEGEDVTFTCTTTGGQGVAWSLGAGSSSPFITANNSDTRGLNVSAALVLGSLGSPLLLRGVGRSLNGLSIVCNTFVNGVITRQAEPYAILTVTSLPRVIDVSEGPPAPPSNGDFFVTFTLDANPPVVSNDVVILRKGQVSTRFSTNTTAATLSNVTCDDEGTYTIRSTNSVGSSTTSFVLSVVKGPPTFMPVPMRTVGVNPTDVKLTSYVIGCPDTIVITCIIVGGGSSLTSTVDVGDNTPVLWDRYSFSSGLSGGTAQLQCTATNSNGTSASVLIDVFYGSIRCDRKLKSLLYLCNTMLKSVLSSCVDLPLLTSF
jgi:hypothetical protein